MKIAKPRSKKPLLITVAATLIIIASVAAYWFLAGPGANRQTAQDTVRPENTVDYNPPTEEQKKAGEDIKKEAIDKSQNNQQSPPPDSYALGLTINNATQMENAVLIRSVVTGTTKGDCEAVFTMDGQQKISHAFAISTDATTASCNTDISASSFPASGTWTLTLTAKDGTKSSPTVTQKVTINN